MKPEFMPIVCNYTIDTFVFRDLTLEKLTYIQKYQFKRGKYSNTSKIDVEIIFI